MTAAIPHGAAAGAAWEGDGRAGMSLPWLLGLGGDPGSALWSRVEGGVTALLLWQLLELGRYQCPQSPRASTAELAQHWDILQAW